jgi:hypothetical protein
LEHCAEVFPSVETLEAEETDENFYMNLLQIYFDSKWPNLKVILEPEYDSHIPIYVTCLLEYWKNIINATLCDRVNAEDDAHDDEGIQYFTDQYDRLAKRLKDFHI